MEKDKSCKYKQNRAGAARSDKIGFKQKLLPEVEKIFYTDEDPLGRRDNNKYIYIYLSMEAQPT